MITCNNDRAVLGYNFCITHNEETNTVSASFCSYFELNGHNISEPGFITLSSNISELNDYMCGLMNRKLGHSACAVSVLTDMDLQSPDHFTKIQMLWLFKYLVWCATLSTTGVTSSYYLFLIVFIFQFNLIPALVLFSFVTYKLLKKPLKEAAIMIKLKSPQAKLQFCCSGHN